MEVQAIAILLIIFEEMISWGAFFGCLPVCGRRKASSIFSIWRYFSFYIWLFFLVFLELYQVEEVDIQRGLVALMVISYIVVRGKWLLA